MVKLCKNNHIFCYKCIDEYVNIKMGFLERLICCAEYCNN